LGSANAALPRLAEVAMSMIRTFFDNFESIFCRLLLVGFVCLLFAQIVSREVFGVSITWIEELSVYMFVWFVYFGASYAAKMAAHNRVTFQFGFLSKKATNVVEAVADLFWIFFNIYFIYLATDFVFNKMNKFWKSQTLGIEMKYIYMVLPIAFTLMTIRVLQVNYQRLVLGIDVRDPEKIELDEITASSSDAAAPKSSSS
jgi:TRAP-type C4-dicarboxylate transport system permease small subunit